jgi:hypothetical protein
MSRFNDDLVEKIASKLTHRLTRVKVKRALGEDLVAALEVGAKEAAQAGSMRRDDFDAMPPKQQSAFMRKGGRVVDPGTTASS